jgi:hypothetical protein
LRKAVTGALIAVAVMAGCGGDDEETTTSGDQGAQQAQPTTTETQQTQPSAAPSGEIPSYEDVAKIAAEFSSAKQPCARKREDRDIGSYPDGEVYKRMFCGGSPRMDYVVGKEAFAENFEAARDGQRSPLWRYEEQAYATGPALDDEFAEKVRDACDCGEVVPGGLK